MNRDRAEVDCDLASLNGFLCRRCILEVDDSEAAIAHDSHLLHRHEDAFDRSKLGNDLLAELSFCHSVRDFCQPDTLGVWNLLLLLLSLFSFLGLESFGVENALFRLSDGRLSTLLILFSLVFLEVLDCGFEFGDVRSFDIVTTTLSLPVTHLSSQVFFFGLDLIVRMPDIISMEHRNVGIASDRVSLSADTKRVKNRISESTLSIAFRHRELRLQDAAVIVFDNGASISKFNLLNSFTDISNFRNLSFGLLQSVFPGSEAG